MNRKAGSKNIVTACTPARTPTTTGLGVPVPTTGDHWVSYGPGLPSSARNAATTHRGHRNTTPTAEPPWAKAERLKGTDPE